MAMKNGDVVNIIEGAELQSLLMEYLEDIGNVITSTMGPNGANCFVIPANGGRGFMTKDGVTVATYLKFPDNPFKNAVAGLVQDAAKATVQLAGDGTTTCTLLLCTLAKGLLSYLKENPTVSPFSVANELDWLVEKTCLLLNGQQRVVDNLEDLEKVALIAANGNATIAKLVSGVVFHVGADGDVAQKQSPTTKTYTKYSTGYSFDSTILDHRFIVDASSGSTTLDNPLVLIINHKLESLDHLTAITQALKEEARAKNRNSIRPLLIITEDLFGSAKSLILNNMNQYPIFVVKAPDFGMKREMFLEDVKYLTSTPRIFTKTAGVSLDTLGDDYLANAEEGRMRDEKWREFGSAAQVIIKTEGITLIPESNIDSAIRVKEIESRIKEENNSEIIDFLKLRISKLYGKATIYVGSQTTLENTNTNMAIDDTIRACLCAMKEGILPGGGFSYLHVAKVLETYKEEAALEINSTAGENTDYVLDIFIKAMTAPQNFLYKGGSILIKDVNPSEIWQGVDLDGFTGDCLDIGIVDPILVITTALKSSASVVKQLITTKNAIIYDYKTK